MAPANVPHLACCILTLLFTMPLPPPPAPSVARKPVRPLGAEGGAAEEFAVYGATGNGEC